MLSPVADARWRILDAFRYECLTNRSSGAGFILLVFCRGPLALHIPLRIERRVARVREGPQCPNKLNLRDD